MTDPFKVLGELEERVKKAEQRIPELEDKLADSGKALFTMKSQNDELVTKLKRFEALETALKELLPSSPSVSSGATGTVEIHDSAGVLGVKDPAQKLVAETTTVIGQVGQCILDGYIVPKRMRVGEVEELLASHFNAKWGKGQVQMGLETLTAPPYRLFVHSIDSQKRHFFQLRETVKDRIVKE